MLIVHPETIMPAIEKLLKIMFAEEKVDGTIKLMIEF